MANEFLGRVFARAVTGRVLSVSTPVSWGIANTVRNVINSTEDEEAVEEIPDEALLLNDPPQETFVAPIASAWARRELDGFRRQTRHYHNNTRRFGNDNMPAEHPDERPASPFSSDLNRQTPSNNVPEESLHWRLPQ